ncbi:aminoglycoside phosphotransferase family protein [Candidatus Saccharibacteria bacterium]|nr:aminoglycoside phosphotransferase family protein [Candidatus Saccharibacteria bacterium]
MMTTQDNQKFVELIKSHEPTAGDIEFVEHGYDNIVAVVDRQKVFRFPRTEVDKYRLWFEAELLQKMAGKIPKTPRVIRLNQRPFYAVYSYLPGNHLSEEEIGGLSAKDQAEIGNQLADFIASFNKLISPSEVLSLRSSSGLAAQPGEETWPIYLKRVLGDSSFPSNPKIEQLAKDYYQKWLNLKDDLPIITVHDDLHAGNLLFSDGQISGIFDFGNASAGTATQEMRNILRLGDDVLRASISRYQDLTGQTVDPEKARFWMIVNDLASICLRLLDGKTDAPGFARAQKNLKKWGVISDVAG